jgi:hypothetical protein
MTRAKLINSLFIVLVCGAFLPLHADDVFTDNTFNLTSNYTTTTFTAGGATVTPTQCATCGNPNGAGNTALQITMTFPTGTSTADSGYVNNTFSYNPLVQGAITSINASVDKDLFFNPTVFPGSAGNTFHPMIEQGGVFYFASIPGVGLTNIMAPGTTGYETLSQAGLVATDFVSFDFTTGLSTGTNPNFDGGTMLFGLAQISGSNAAATLTADYDNLNLHLVTAAVPEPSSLVLFGVVLVGLIVISRRKLAFKN